MFLAYARWILGIMAVCAFLYIAAGNLYLLYLNRVKAQRHSLIPLVGGVLGALGLLSIPAQHASEYWWIPLILDFGALPLVVITILWFIYRSILKNR